MVCGFCRNMVLIAEFKWSELTPVIKELPGGVMLRGETLQQHAMALCNLCHKAVKEKDWDEVVDRALVMFYFTMLIHTGQEINRETVETVKARIEFFKELNIEVIE